MVRLRTNAPALRVKPMVSLWADNKRSSRSHRATGATGAFVVDICLHLGAHRTGSTGFQVMLNGQRPALRRAGLAYWGPERTRGGLLAGLVKNPHHLSTRDTQLGQRSCGRLRMEFTRLEHAGVQQLILSEENLIGTMAQNLEAVRLYGQLSGRLERVSPAFEGRGLRIGIAIRAYDLHWASQLAFRVKAGAALPSAADLDRLATQPRRWHDVIADIGDVFPMAQLVVWPFEGWVANPAPLVAALAGRPVALGPMAKPYKSNASAPAAALAKIAAERGDLDGALRLATARHGARYMPFDSEQIWKLQEDYRADIAWLKAGAGPRVTYLDPTEDTFCGADMTEGSHHDREERSVGSAR
ncbi:hypothetical protein BCF46_0585 [Litoreibacter meonggei]|uniref:Uncharacterized protein n=2 Tax=Litoreibacter meonggei TaxID=1049199 RepID=A0A497X548_9RHOB|nr:hypothetical protein BCF46_0585 [Litoreibacter meonggei]